MLSSLTTRKEVWKLWGLFTLPTNLTRGNIYYKVIIVNHTNMNRIHFTHLSSTELNSAALYWHAYRASLLTRKNIWVFLWTYALPSSKSRSTWGSIFLTRTSKPVTLYRALFGKCTIQLKTSWSHISIPLFVLHFPLSRTSKQASKQTSMHACMRTCMHTHAHTHNCMK